MRTILRKIGNSSAVIIPKPFLLHLGAKVGDALDLLLEKDHILLSCAKLNVRKGWAEAARKIARSGTDVLAWPEFSNADDKDLEW